MLAAHFLNVGHGDCTFVDLPSGRLMMVDVNNSRTLPKGDREALAERHGQTEAEFAFARIMETGYRSWSDYYESFLVDPYDYYQEHFKGRSIWRYVQTHPDMDHMSGLRRFFWDQAVGLSNFWDTKNSKELSVADFREARMAEAGYQYSDWEAYQELRNGRHGSPAIGNNVLRVEQSEIGQYWSDDEIAVLSPTPDLAEYCDGIEKWNNVSYVFRVQHAGRRIILPGDAEKPAWDKIETTISTADLKCDVLKAAHHGRESGYSETATEKMDPDFVICSVGKKPSTDASDEYAAQGADVFSTRLNGTITVEILDSGTVAIYDRGHALLGSS